MRLERRQCPICLQFVYLTRKGVFARHKRRYEALIFYKTDGPTWKGAALEHCEGKGMYPHVATLCKFKTDSGHDAEIREGRDGEIYCTCLGWRFSKKPKDCSHLERIRTALATGNMSIFAQMETESIATT